MAAVTCFAIGFVALLAYAGISNNQGPAYYSVSVAGVALHLVWQLLTVDLDSPESCWCKSLNAVIYHIRFGLTLICSKFQAQRISGGILSNGGNDVGLYSEEREWDSSLV